MNLIFEVMNLIFEIIIPCISTMDFKSYLICSVTL